MAMEIDRDIGFVTNNDFLDFDDDDFTEAALQRITQMIASRNETRERDSEVVEQLIMKECKLFISVASMDGIPAAQSCLGLFKPSFWCEIEIMKVKESFSMSPQYPEHGTSTKLEPSYATCTDVSKPSVWDLAEYFGETLITIRILRRKMLETKVVGSRILRLSDMLSKQNEQRMHGQSTSQEQAPWSISHTILITTSMSSQKKKPAPRTSDSWLLTAKNASSTLTSTSAGGHVEHRKPLTPAARPTNQYSPVPTSSSPGEHQRKGAVVAVNIEFRLVQLQHCLMTNIMSRFEQLCPSNTAVETIAGCGVGSGMMQQASELHLLAATAPPAMVVDVMRGLSRKNSLPQALELLTSPPSTGPSAALKPATPAIQRRAGSSNLNNRTTPASEVPPTGWSAFDIALLNGQDATVLEMLQRCGSLCFSNIAAGRSSPLHMAVLGGSVQCVEYVGRYMKKFGTRKVSGPGARLWNSSLSAKLEWRDNNDDTALALACRLPPSAATHSMIVYLLILGADCAPLNIKNKFTPLMYACQSGATKTVATLLSITKSNQEVMDAILNVGDVNSILNNTASLDVEPAVREQIHAAIANSAASARSSALAMHLHTNPRSRNILRGQNLGEGGHFNPLSVYTCEPCRRDGALGRQAAHIAAAHGHTEIVCSLLEIGVSCAETDLYGDNLLHIAARRGNGALVSRLVEAESREWEAFHALVKRGKTLETLHVRARSILLKNCAGDSPLDLALENKHFAMFEELLSAAARLYRTVDRELLQAFATLLDHTAPPPSPASLIQKVLSQDSHDGQDSPSNRTVSLSISSTSRPSSAERHLQKCKNLVASLIAAADSGAATAPQPATRGAEEEGPAGEALLIDNEADSIEYVFALSSLGMKFITDNASTGASSNAVPDSTSAAAPDSPSPSPAAPSPDRKCVMYRAALPADGMEEKTSEL